LAPEILPYEIGNTLSSMVKRRQLTGSEALEAEKSVGRIPVRLLSTDIHSSLKLALEHDIYACDAYFLQCSLELSCPLLTLDRRMKEVARELGIKLLE
jgi:predicted nucleic acid-binding protein